MGIGLDFLGPIHERFVWRGKMPPNMLEPWHDFFVAQVGSSSALTGLLFVAVSLNLKRILEYRSLTIRALECLATLLCLLVISSLMLVPGQSLFAYGVEIAATGILFWIGQTVALVRSLHLNSHEHFVRYLFNQLPPWPYILAGVLLSLDWPHAIYLIVPGVLISILAAVYSAWVLLVEIQR